jgi:hypothetical protein
MPELNSRDWEYRQGRDTRATQGLLEVEKDCTGKWQFYTQHVFLVVTWGMHT